MEVQHTIDIGQILREAQKRLESIGVGDGLATPQNALIEGENSDTDSM